MPAPVVSTTTQAIFDRLPAYQRDGDTAQDDRPLLRFLSLMGDQLGDLVDTFERIQFLRPEEGGEAGDTSDLVDPDTADSGWLHWLAQRAGFEAGDLTVAQLRLLLQNADDNRSVGSREGIAAAAAVALTDTRFVQVRPAGAWTISVETIPDETPDAGAVLDAVLEANQKPAGATLVHAYYSASWATLEATWPTWSDLNNRTWEEREELPPL